MDGILDCSHVPVIPIDRYRADLDPGVTSIFPAHPEDGRPVGRQRRGFNQDTECLPVIRMDKTLDERRIVHTLPGRIARQALARGTDVLDRRRLPGCAYVTIVRPFDEHPEPLLALPESFVSTDPDEEIGKQVADDREQGDIVVRPPPGCPNRLESNDAEELVGGGYRDKDDRSGLILQEKFTICCGFRGEITYVGYGDHSPGLKLRHPPGECIETQVLQHIYLRFDPLRAPLVGVLCAGKVRGEAEDVTPVDAEEDSERSDCLVQGIVQVGRIEGHEPRRERTHHPLKVYPAPDLLLHPLQFSDVPERLDGAGEPPLRVIEQGCLAPEVCTLLAG
ncbi:hypothetical protein DSECCO2_503320 [anaerobic digester metagenome]